MSLPPCCHHRQRRFGMWRVMPYFDWGLSGRRLRLFLSYWFRSATLLQLLLAVVCSCLRLSASQSLGTSVSQGLRRWWLPVEFRSLLLPHFMWTEYLHLKLQLQRLMIMLPSKVSGYDRHCLNNLNSVKENNMVSICNRLSFADNDRNRLCPKNLPDH